MKKNYAFLLLCLSSFVHAESECSIVDDTAETLFQVRQSGFDLGDIDINREALTTKQVVVLDGMIQDVRRMPIYSLQITKDKAYQNFLLKWQTECQNLDHLKNNTVESKNEKAR